MAPPACPGRRRQLANELDEEKRLALVNNVLKREAASFNLVVEAAAEVQATRLSELQQAQQETTRNARALAALRQELEETQAGLDRLEAEANMRRNIAAEGRRVRRARDGGERAHEQSLLACASVQRCSGAARVG